MADDLDQDALAAEWANAMEDSGATEAKTDDDALADEWAAALEESSSDDEGLADEWAAALAETELEEVNNEKKDNFYQNATEANFADMTEASKAPRSEDQRHELDFILDIPLDVSAELGRTRLLINELLQLGQGSVIELNKLAGEPLEVFVNGKLVARGEAVVINEKFGIRLTDIISPIERVKQLS